MMETRSVWVLIETPKKKTGESSGEAGKVQGHIGKGILEQFRNVGFTGLPHDEELPQDLMACAQRMGIVAKERAKSQSVDFCACFAARWYRFDRETTGQVILIVVATSEKPVYMEIAHLVPGSKLAKATAQDWSETKRGIQQQIVPEMPEPRDRELGQKLSQAILKYLKNELSKLTK